MKRRAEAESPTTGDPLNLIRLIPSKGETHKKTVPSLCFDGAVFLFQAECSWPEGSGSYEYER